jgi:hypothetical protein
VIFQKKDSELASPLPGCSIDGADDKPLPPMPEDDSDMEWEEEHDWADDDDDDVSSDRKVICSFIIHKKIFKFLPTTSESRLGFSNCLKFSRTILETDTHLILAVQKY